MDEVTGAPRRPKPWQRARRTVLRVLRAVRRWRPRHGWGPAIGLVAAGLLVSVVFGVTTASVQAAFGPHMARYDVTTDSTVTVDLGPLGTLELDSPLPLALGVRATVQEIPASVTELGEARTLQALTEDLNAYVSFFSGPAAAVRDVADALVSNVLLRSGLAFVALVCVFWAVRALLGADRRRELTAALAGRARPLTAGTLVVVLGATVLTSSVGPGDRPVTTGRASAVFQGTPLEGARVTGRLGGVIDTYGAYAVDAWRQNEEFYRAADEALVVAWEDWEADEERLAEQAAAQEAAERAARRRAEQEAARAQAAADEAAAATGAEGEDPAARDGADDGADDVTAGADGATGDGSASDGSASDGSPADGATSDPGPADTLAGEADADVVDGTGEIGGEDGDGVRGLPTPTEEPEAAGHEVDPVVLVVVSDLHCNVGMAPLIGTLARLAGADAVLDAGDTTMNGTSVEQYCVTSFARAVPPGVALVTSPGNHDSRETSARYDRAGAIVLAGGVVDVAGVRILGDHDPNETRVGGGGTVSTADESVAEAGRRLADVACDDGEVDLLLVHSPAVGDAALDSGCVPAQVSGHYHRRSGPEQVGSGVRYVSSSTAGATLNQPTVGPLRGVAEMTVLRFDPAGRRFVDHQVVRVAPDGTVTVGRPQPWPLPTFDVPTDVDDRSVGRADEDGDTPPSDEAQPGDDAAGDTDG